MTRRPTRHTPDQSLLWLVLLLVFLSLCMQVVANVLRYT